MSDVPPEKSMAAAAGSSDRLQGRALLITDRCEALSLRIAKEAARVERKQQRLRLVNILVGALAALVTISTPVAELIGPHGAQGISVIAAIVLIFDGLIPYFSRDPSPDRLRDYAFYVFTYSGMIHTTLANDDLTEAQRRSRVAAILDIAETNISDICGKFPILYEEAIHTPHHRDQILQPMNLAKSA